MAAVNKMQNLKHDKICRACLQIKKDMRPLFDQLTATMLMGISKVQVAVGDGLPAQLCLQCVGVISRFHAFKEMVERNDITLREHANFVEELKRERIEKEDMLNQDCNETPYIFFTTDPLEDITEEVVQTDLVEVKVEEVPATTVSNSDDDFNSDEETFLELSASQMITYVSPRRHICNLCQMEFGNARWLMQHLRSHSNWIKANCKRRPICTLCGRSFTGPGMLKMHMRSHEQRPPKQPTCTVCKRIFPSKAKLYRHRQTHFKQKT